MRLAIVGLTMVFFLVLASAQEPQVTVLGDSSDAVGVLGCKWRLGSAPDANNGTACTGTTSFSCTTTGYLEGANAVYVGCYDAAGNYGSDSITINLNSGPPSPANLLFSESFEDASWSSRGWYDSSSQGSIVAGGQSGNALQWAWTAGQTQPTNGAAIRNTFTDTDELFVSVYMKFSSTWRGSQQTYHPHMIHFLSDQDSDYTGLSANYLNAYIEVVADVGSPYELRPVTALQDVLRVNTSYGTPPVDITATTENRSTNYCNGYLAGQDSGTSSQCYSLGGGYYYSATLWSGVTEIPKDQWVKIETHIKMNSISGGVAQPDGIMKQWIDGVLWLNKSNIVYRTNQHATMEFDKIVLAPYIGDGSPITQTMWIDELKVYDGLLDTDTTPPVLSGLSPTGDQASVVTSIALALTTDEAATCRYDLNGVSDYDLMTNYTSTGSTSHSATVNVLPGRVYVPAAKCRDSAGNTSDLPAWRFAIPATPKRRVRH